MIDDAPPAKYIEYEDMSDSQKKIVDAATAPPAGTIPTGLSREEMRIWMNENWFVKK